VSQDKPFLFIVDLRYFVTVTENWITQLTLGYLFVMVKAEGISLLC
jgi:hypothetical protein